MNKKFFLWVFVFFIFIFSSFADDGSVMYEQNSDVVLYQICDSCSFVNLESVIFPSGDVSYLNYSMVKNGFSYTYNWSNTSELGEYFYFVCGDKNNVLTCESLSFYVSKNGVSNEEMFRFNLIYVLSLTVILSLLMYVAFNIDVKHMALKFIIVSICIFLGVTFIRNMYLVSSFELVSDLNKYYMNFIKVYVIYVFLAFLWFLGEYYGKTEGIKQLFKDKFGRGG